MERVARAVVRFDRERQPFNPLYRDSPLTASDVARVAEQSRHENGISAKAGLLAAVPMLSLMSAFDNLAWPNDQGRARKDHLRGTVMPVIGAIPNPVTMTANAVVQIASAAVDGLQSMAWRVIERGAHERREVDPALQELLNRR
jgi:hypothetical protein